MLLNPSNSTEAINLNAFPLGQVVELQIMAEWVHLLTYLLFVTNLSLSNFSMLKAQPSIKHTDLKSPDKEIHFFLKKRKNGFDLNSFNFA